MEKNIKRLLYFCISILTTIPLNGSNDISPKKNDKSVKTTKKYKPKPIKSNNKQENPTVIQTQLVIDNSEDYYYKAIKGNVIIKTKTFGTKRECCKFFGPTGKYLLTRRKKAIYPVKITIENKSNKTWIFDIKTTNLKTAPNHHILRRLHNRTKLRAFLSGIGLFLGAATIFTLGVPLVPCALMPLIGVPDVICGAFAYPFLTFLAPIEAIATPAAIASATTMTAAAPLVSAARAESMERSNQEITKIVKTMTKQKKLIIKPGETKTTYMFIRNKNYKKYFSVTLVNKLNDKENLNFDIACQPV